MQLAKEKKLAVEVGEWINKSSGRGEFLIMTVDKNGRSKKLFEKTIWGFGVRPYEEVLSDVFPWADLVIDEDYYKIHGDPKYIEFRKKQNRRHTAGKKGIHAKADDCFTIERTDIAYNRKGDWPCGIFSIWIFHN